MFLAIALNGVFATLLLVTLFLVLWRVGWRNVTYGETPDILSGRLRNGSAIIT